MRDKFNSKMIYVGCCTLVAVTLLVQPTYLAKAQVEAVRAGVVELPRGPITRIPSPDRHWTLIFECPDLSKERKLWVEDSSSHARKLVKEYERSLAIAWAPDSERFFVNDDYGSNGSLSYVIEPATLKTIDLRAIIVGSDAKATQFLGAGHSYLRSKQWLSSHELLVAMFGHFDGSPARGFPARFTLKYRVDLNGHAQKIFEASVEEPQ